MSKVTGYANAVEVKGNEGIVKAIHSLSKHGLITFSREQFFKSSKYYISFFKPTEQLKNLYNLGNEVLVVCCIDAMRDFRSRTKDFIDYLITNEEFNNRLDRLTCIVIDSNKEILTIVNQDRKDNPDSRLIIPFYYEELQRGITEDDLNNRFRECLYVRDLFGIGSPLNNESMFFGKDRTNLITDLHGKYKQGEPGGLFGLRRIGKTSVLYLLKKRIIRDNGVAVYFDCSRYHHIRWNLFLLQIIEKIIEEYSAEQDQLVGIQLPNGFPFDNTESRYSEEKAINSFEQDLLKLYSAFGNVRILLIFDEIESIGFGTSPSDNWRKGNDALFFWEAIRSIKQMNNSLFSYVIAGVNPMCIEVSTINGTANPVFGSFSPIYMRLFDYDDVSYMVSSIGGHLGLSFDSQVCAKLVEDYGGHPFLTRQVCSIINKSLLERKVGRPYKITKYEYEKHSDEFSIEMTSVIEQILAVLDTYYPEEYELLKKLALNGRDSIKKGEGEGDRGVRHLLGYCLIDKHEGEYYIRIKSIEQYLQQQFIYDKSLNDQTDIRTRINLRRDKIESKLRALIWTTVRLKFGKKASERIMAMAKKSTSDEKQEMRLKGKAGQELMEELYLSQLGILIDSSWKDYDKIFIDKRKFNLYFEILNQARTVGSHTKAVSEEDEFEYNQAFKYFEEVLSDM